MVGEVILELIRKTATVDLIRPNGSAGRNDLIYFPIYSPWVVDTQGEGVLDKTLIDCAHDWMIRGRMANVDIEHDGEPVNCRVVESWIVAGDKDGRSGDSRFPIVGTWAGAMKIFDPAIVEKVEAGEINGVSLMTEYPPLRTRYPTVVSNPVRAQGVTGLSLEPGVEPHSHGVDIGFDETTWEVPGFTAESLGHWHPYQYATATEMNDVGGGVGDRTAGSGTGKNIVPHAHRIDLNKLAVEYATKVQIVTWLTSVSVVAISLVKHGANWMPLVSLKRAMAREVITWPGR